MAKRREEMKKKAKVLKTLGKDGDCTFKRILSINLSLTGQERRGDKYVSTIAGVARIAGRPGGTSRKRYCTVPIGSSIDKEIEVLSDAITSMLLSMTRDEEPAEKPPEAPPEAPTVKETPEKGPVDSGRKKNG